MNDIGCSSMFLSLIQADYHFNFQHALNIVFGQKQLESTNNNLPTVKFAISDVELVLGSGDLPILVLLKQMPIHLKLLVSDIWNFCVHVFHDTPRRRYPTYN